MNGVGTLALPFFGLILLGYACGKLIREPEEGLAWMNFFILYVALPALFFKLVSATPFEQFANWPFALATSFSTYCIFALAFALAIVMRRSVPDSAIAATAGSYANVGYMGPGLTIAALGSEASVPVALIFVTDSMLFFTLVPLIMALSGTRRQSIAATLRLVLMRVALHPFNLATAAGVVAASFDIELPRAVDQTLEYLKNAAAPCALFVLGVTVALRPLRQVPAELPLLVVIKLALHPVLAYLVLGYIGGYPPVWVYTAVLMASLPPALNTFVLARQYNAYVEPASSAVLIGTLVSVLTVTGMLYLLTGGWLSPQPFGR
jgi:malonate transporter and related proteins